jgi:steroid delta-isomerase-like uncharacterized protein
MSEDAKTLLAQFYDEIWQKKDFSAIDRMVSPDVVDHMPMLGLGGDFEGHKQATIAILSAFPDATFTIGEIVAEGDRAAGRWIMQATHSGEIMGIPATGKPVQMSGMDMARFEDGMMKEVWHIEDVLGMLQQIGVIPSGG